MPAAEATEKRISTAIMTELAKIGGAGDWLTVPQTPVAGAPGSSIPSVASNPLLYLQYLRTARNDDGIGTEGSTESVRVHFGVWCIAKNQDDLVRLKADVIRTIHAARATFTSAFQQPVWWGAFQYTDDLKIEGGYAGGLELYIDTELDPASP